MPVLLELCHNGPPSGAKAAPRAILAIVDRSSATRQLAALAEELTGRLGKAGATADPQLPVILTALSSIGRLLPEARASALLLLHMCSPCD